jgi:hypothetical protein
VTSLDDIVADYCARVRERADAERAYFAGLPTLAAAVTAAGLAQDGRGRRFAHQRRMPDQVLLECVSALSEALPRLRQAPSFEDLHDAIREEIGGIHGVGRLMVYDTAVRIGAHRGLEPARVFLHAGTRIGARRLGLDSSAESLSVADLPAALRRLRPHEIEDVLCIYKDEFDSATAP